MPSSIRGALLDESITTCILSDVMDALGHYGVLHHKIRSLNGTRKIVGQAYTVQWVENRKTSKILDPQVSTWQQVRDFVVPNVKKGEGQGRVYVAGAGSLLEHSALAGGASSTYLQEHLGFEGIVLGGAIRDGATIEALTIPVMATNYVPIDTQGAYRVLSTGFHCIIENIKVVTGDWIVGDQNGVVVIPEKMGDTVVKAALRLASRECDVRKRINEGMRLPDIVDQLGAI